MNRFPVLFCVLLCLSCVSRVQPDKQWGEQARVWLTDDSVRDGELLAVTSTSLLFADRAVRMVSDIPLTSIERVRVQDYSQMGLRVAGMVPTVVAYAVTAIVMVTSQSAWAKGLSVLPMLAAGGSAWAFLAGDPKVSFGPDFDGRTVTAMRVYCRYPYGLTDEQRALIVAANGGRNP